MKLLTVGIALLVTACARGDERRTGEQQSVPSPSTNDGSAQPFRQGIDSVREQSPTPMLAERPAPFAPPSWKVIPLFDAFNEPVGAAAVSEISEPVRPMGFPYHDVEAALMVICDNALIRFNQEPNLTGGDFYVNHWNYETPVRVDGGPWNRWHTSQFTDGSELDFREDAHAIRQISSGSRLDIMLEWFGEGVVGFRWDLDGSSAAIAESCEGQ